MVKQFVMILLICSLSICKPLTVTFLNPGTKTGDPFFGRMVSVMEAAAKNLNISLEIIYSERDFTKAIEEGSKICARKVKPDFLLVINEDGIAERIIPKADSAGIRTVVFNEGFSKKYLAQNGHPTSKYKKCIAEIVPNDSLAGYLLAMDLIRLRRAQFPNKPITIFGIEGSPRTNSSDRRTAGLRQAVKVSKNVTLLQTAPAYWEFDNAKYVMSQALKRYPNIDIVWTASDLMADGVLEVKKTSGKDFMIGGIDWASFAFDRIRTGEFASSVGGHFFDGVWALVLVKDISETGKCPGKVFTANSFAAANRNNIGKLAPIFSQDNWSGVNFSKYLRSSGAKSCDFSLSPILKDLGVYE